MAAASSSAARCSGKGGVALLLLLVLAAVTGTSSAAPQPLCTSFYSDSCPGVYDAVWSVLQAAIAREQRMGASILRLFFHDCFVQGCDASLLLDDTPSFQGEKMATPNNGSARGFEVIDAIKSAVEKVCPGVVSCADILAIAARDSVVILGGPRWDVKVGRRDSRTASFSGANNNIPPPTSGLANLTSLFAAQGLSQKDMVALSGAHTIGLARCTSFRAHVYNDTNIDGSFARYRQSVCPRTSGSGDNNLAPLDLQTPTVFENNYYKNLVSKKGLLHSDQELFNGRSTDAQVQSYVHSRSAFFADFVTGMIKMGDITPLTGSKGEIRKNCRRIN
ncbi:peroxidase 4-like [Miscanthus floridulus]|uniref:peroxidase 4-like n=1 Tax=Miscanthus floridulus TaxID=154761 RepID=UPI00345A88FD